MENLSNQPTYTGVDNYTFNIETVKNGIWIEMTDNTPLQIGQYYNRTSVFIPNLLTRIGNSILQDCSVSWYKNDSCVQVDSNGTLKSAKGGSLNVLTYIDIEKLQTNDDYKISIMRTLFSRHRVISYLQRGHKENLAPNELPCGRYIGYISTENCQPYFDAEIGELAHNLPEMIQAREDVRKAAEASRTYISLPPQLEEK